MTPDSPFEGDVPSDGEEPSYEWLDEWLCEYVDGTMDPSLETVFEQYVDANPELKAHVKRLRKTRELLCNCGLPTDSSPDVDAEQCREKECDVEPETASAGEPARPRPVAAVGLVSSVAAALIVGFLAGAVMVDPGPSTSALSLETNRPGQTSTRSASEASRVQRTRTAPPEQPAVFQHRSDVPFAHPDSAADPSALTTIGLP